MRRVFLSFSQIDSFPAWSTSVFNKITLLYTAGTVDKIKPCGVMSQNDVKFLISLFQKNQLAANNAHVHWNVPDRQT